MRNLLLAARSLLGKGQHNLMKIASLGVGLSVALILVAKIYFEQSYDKFYPNVERIYRLTESFQMSDGRHVEDNTSVPGAVAPGMQAEVPGVEKATRLTYWFGKGTTFTTPDKNRYVADNVMFADSNIFDVLPRPMLIGDSKEILSRALGTIISRSLAEKLGGVDKAVGTKIRMDGADYLDLKVSGVFEDVPENSHQRYDILVSMESYPKSSRENWFGNDRYMGYVRLAPGVTPKSLKPAIQKMFERHVDVERLQKSGVKLEFGLKPLLDLHVGVNSVKNLMTMLGILAFTLLFTAVMNYILISISSIVNRTREVAVRKAYGASTGNIHGLIVSETLVHMLLALLLAVLIIYTGRDWVERLLDVSVETLLFSKGALVLLAVCVVVFLVTAYVPGILFARIPVAAAFRNFKESRRIWKLGLLFLQFISVSLLVSLLLVVSGQYRFMMNDNPGYAYDRLAYVDLSIADSTQCSKLVEEIQRLPAVEHVTTCYTLPIGPNISGNNVSLPGDNRELFNIADQYECGNGYLEMLEVPIIEGRSFTENVVSSDEVMVNRAFVEKMNQFVDWSDGAVGKYILVTEHSQNPKHVFRICGVFENYRLGSLVDLDERPTVLFYRKSGHAMTLAIKFKAMTSEAFESTRQILRTLVPDKDLQLEAYSVLMENVYSDARKFRDQVMIGGIITLIISLIGLIGYTNDEVNRRRKELAVRKINGATLRDIMQLFIMDIMKIAVPAIVFGGIGAYYVAEQWQQQFAEKVSLSAGIFLFGSLLVALIVFATVVYRVYGVASDNPVNSLKSE